MLALICWLLFCLHVVEGSTFCSERSNTSCSDCLVDLGCYWCDETKICGERSGIKPSAEQCDGKWNAYNVCAMSGTGLIVIMFVSALVFFFILLLVIYCCCCRQCCRERSIRKWNKEDERRQYKRDEREAKHAERQSEMQARHQQIRKKYGLFQDSTKYEQFD